MLKNRPIEDLLSDIVRGTSACVALVVGADEMVLSRREMLTGAVIQPRAAVRAFQNARKHRHLADLRVPAPVEA